MGLRSTHKGILGALALSFALLGCIRDDGFYPLLAALPTVNSLRVRPPLAIEPEDEPSTEKNNSSLSLSGTTVSEEKETKEEKSDIPAMSVDPDPGVPPEKAVEMEPPPKAFFRESASAVPTYFVNREVKSSNIRMFPRWTGMLSRFTAEARTLDSVCGSSSHTPCKLKEWKDFLEGVRDLPLMEKLKEVNRFLNKYPYVEDVANYWKTPYEFQRISGNCKDYAIAKFMSLRALGLSNGDMRLMVLRDLNLGGIIHAVLVVSVGEKTYILDNQIKQVVPTDRVYHYVPIYSINEEHWWQHFIPNTKGLS